MLANLAVWAMNVIVLQGSNWDLRAMWSSMSIIAKVVVGILFLLSAWSLGVMIDRVLMYSAARKQSRVFVQQVAGALRRQARRSHLHRRAQQEEPHRQGCGDGPLGIPIRIFAGR